MGDGDWRRCELQCGEDGRKRQSTSKTERRSEHNARHGLCRRFVNSSPHGCIRTLHLHQYYHHETLDAQVLSDLAIITLVIRILLINKQDPPGPAAFSPSVIPGAPPFMSDRQTIPQHRHILSVYPFPPRLRLINLIIGTNRNASSSVLVNSSYLQAALFERSSAPPLISSSHLAAIISTARIDLCYFVFIYSTTPTCSIGRHLAAIAAACPLQIASQQSPPLNPPSEPAYLPASILIADVSKQSLKHIQISEERVKARKKHTKIEQARKSLRRRTNAECAYRMCRRQDSMSSNDLTIPPSTDLVTCESQTHHLLQRMLDTLTIQVCLIQYFLLQSVDHMLILLQPLRSISAIFSQQCLAISSTRSVNPWTTS